MAVGCTAWVSGVWNLVETGVIQRTMGTYLIYIYIHMGIMLSLGLYKGPWEHISYIYIHTYIGFI